MAVGQCHGTRPAGKRVRSGARRPAEAGSAGREWVAPVREARCYGVVLLSRGDTFLTSGAQGLSEVQPRRLEGSRPLLRSGFVVFEKEEADSLVKRL
jgi:hypothetical protein